MTARYVPTPEEVPSGICECGCGGQTPIASSTWAAKRRFKGYPMRFMAGHHAKSRKRGPGSSNWKGGVHLSSEGYVMVYAPDHPAAANQKGYVLEHRLVMETHIGRRLTSSDLVHHVNGDRTDNRLENLQLMTRSEHMALHNPRQFFDDRAALSAAGKKGAEARWGRP